MIDGLWGEDPPPGAERTLRAHLSRLRGALVAAGADPSVVVHDGSGYRLDISPAQVDAERFATLLRRARSSGHAQPDLWRAAVDEWSGEALAGCVETPAVAALRVGLVEERLATIDGWATAALAVGDPTVVIAPLEALVAEHPLRETSWARLVRALTSAGRPAEAAEAYQRARRSLVEHAGLDPGAELREAEVEALTASEAAAPAVKPRAVVAVVGHPAVGPEAVEYQ